MVQSSSIASVMGFIMCGIFAIGAGISVVVAQMNAPFYFSLIEARPSGPATAFVRAAIAKGDTTLLKDSFADAMRTEYTKVFDPYIRENELSHWIDGLKPRLIESRDIAVAQGFISVRQKNYDEAAAYFAEAARIDPLVDVPQTEISL